MEDKTRFNVGYVIFAVFAMLFTNSGSRDDISAIVRR